MSLLIEDFLKSLESQILYIYGFTSIICLFFAWILYNSSTTGIGRWIRLLGWFYFSFFLMYVLKTFVVIYSDFRIHLNVLIQALSTINNLLIFLVSIELLSGQIRQRFDEKKNIFVSFLHQIRIFVPFHYKLLALVTTIVSIAEAVLSSMRYSFDSSIVELVMRLPAGVFSAICFFHLGYALWVNITFLHKRWVGVIGLIPIIIYAFTQIPYIFFPILFSNRILQLVDFSVFTLSTFFKIAIFATAYYLGIKILEGAMEIRFIMSLVINTRKNFLSTSGILESIGKVLKANSVTLFIKVPSKSNLGVTQMKWSIDDYAYSVSQNHKYYQVDNFIEIKEILEGRGINQPKMSWDLFYYFLSSKNQDLVSMYSPIVFNGAIIGCLEIELNRLAATTSVVNYQIQKFVSGISTAVQDYRENLSLKYANNRCAAYRFEEDILNSSDAIKRIAEVIDDILAPDGLRIVGNIGFKQINYTIANDYEKTDAVKKTSILNSFPNDFSDFLDKKVTDKLQKDLNLLPLETRLEFALNDVFFGKLFLLVKADKDLVNSPTLGINPMNRRAIAAIVSNSFCDLVRDYLNRNLSELGVNLRKEGISINQWFQRIELAAKNVELLWAVATNPDSENEFLGNENHIKIVKAYWDNFEKGNEYVLFAYPITEKKDTNHIITLRLKNTHQTFWFGVENPSFGFELYFNSPWKMFLEHLADIADATLIKIQSQDKQVENTSHHALATMATTTGTLVHQLVNMSKNNEVGFKAIYDAIMSGRLAIIENDEKEKKRKELMYKKLALGLKDSGKEMLELTKAFREVTQFSEEKPSSLLKAFEKAKNLFSLVLTQNNIFIEESISSDIQVDIPFHIVSLALANLFSNSKDALKGYKTDKKKITVIATEEKDRIHCFVSDTGPGISKNMQSDIFRLGKTTKIGNGGWGLYLVKRALRENGSDIELVSSVPNHTEFKLTFPKVRKQIS